tara:strand:+ start:337 stop:579 length:243 start_codon:yes stop_codon:yes gene_type:complete
MNEDAEIDAGQAYREIRLTMAALQSMENEAYELLLKTPFTDDKQRVELIALINVVRSLPAKLQTHIDTAKIQSHNPYEEQ